VLCLVDTLRADRLGIYGYEQAVTPNIDALARECVVFDRAYAAAPWTLPSVVSMMTSQLPLEHRVTARGDVVSDAVRTIPERFQDLGYRTAGFVTNPYGSVTAGLVRGYDLLVPPGDRKHAPAGRWRSSVGTGTGQAKGAPQDERLQGLTEQAKRQGSSAQAPDRPGGHLNQCDAGRSASHLGMNGPRDKAEHLRGVLSHPCNLCLGLVVVTGRSDEHRLFKEWPVKRIWLVEERKDSELSVDKEALNRNLRTGHEGFDK
jgi:hypothetical protein